LPLPRSTGGRFDALVNNVTPPIARKPFEELGWDDVDRFWETYVDALTLTQAALPVMKERGFGRVVHVLTSAVLGKPPANWAGDVATKSGLCSVTKAMAVELAPYGITVSAVSWSTVMTDQWESSSERRLGAMALTPPARRLAAPEDVAPTITFLLGPEGAYLHRANLPVAGAR
jgi:3-oxoacyl-[acyl-carrier protein] reductase